MNGQQPRQLSLALRRIANALARLLLRYGLPFDEFAQVLKQAYVATAQREFSLTRRPASKSRIALLTGLNRREVAKLLEQEEQQEPEQPALGPIGRIVAAWVRELQFHTSDGRPSRLTVEGEELSLEALIRHCAVDIPPKAVLRELLNQGLVTQLEDGRLELLSQGYLPKADEAEKLHIFGTDVAALISTIDFNLQQPEQARFQRKVSFDNLSPEGVERLREITAERAYQLLLDLDRELAPYNQSQGGSFAGLGIYQFAMQTPGESHDD